MIESSAVKELCIKLGFDACGIAHAEALTEDRRYLSEWLTRGMHGTMDWMARNVEMRTDPSLLMEGARSLIVVLLNYYPSSTQEASDAPVFSKYAYGRDYHKVMKKKLRKLEAFIHEQKPGAVSRAFVDSAPLMERSWAVKAGLGWTGKHSLLITRNGGSFCFIGVVLTDLELEYDPPFPGDLCGSCTRCIEACPTGAIVSAGVVDARKCISYLTIEHKGELNENLHGRVFGCDICQDVCPWNKLSFPHSVSEFNPNPRLLSMKKEDWINLSEEEYREIFKGTAVDRIGYMRLKQNVALASGKENGQ
jgi:epoxyqueuosine reductase